MKKVFVWKIKSLNAHYLLENIDVSEDDTLNSASGKLIPGGAYTTFRTFEENKVLPLTSHIKRLEDSARLANVPVLLKSEQIRAALKETVLLINFWKEKRIRITIDLEKEPGTVYISAEKLHTPAYEAYQKGVKAITYNFQRKNPKAKLTNHIMVAEKIRQELPKDIDEAIMVREDGSLLEGLSSNFFAVLNGKIYTADEGILPGIIRCMALEQAKSFNIPVVLKSVSENQIQSFEEAFITSASRLVLPVTSIDGRQINQGIPGKMTKKLLEGLINRISQELEDI